MQIDFQTTLNEQQYDYSLLEFFCFEENSTNPKKMSKLDKL